MSKWTKRTLEAEIANVILRVHRAQQTRGPEDARVHILGNLVIARYIGVLTANELLLATTEEGQRLIRASRQELRYITRAESEDAITRLVGHRVLRSYSDVNVEAAEMVELYLLAENIERELMRREMEDLNGAGKRRPV